MIQKEFGNVWVDLNHSAWLDKPCIKTSKIEFGMYYNLHVLVKIELFLVKSMTAKIMIDLVGEIALLSAGMIAAMSASPLPNPLLQPKLLPLSGPRALLESVALPKQLRISL